MNIEDLEVPCEHCSGSGKVKNLYSTKKNPEFYSCYMCNGRGKNLSSLGDKLMKFFNSYKPWQQDIDETISKELRQYNIEKNNDY